MMGSQSLPKLVAVAIDKDRGSQVALRWAVDSLLTKGQSVILMHVKIRTSSNFSHSASLYFSTPRLSQPADDSGLMNGDESDPETREIFLPFRVFCMRKDVQCYEVSLEHSDPSKAIVEYVNRTAIEVVILGAATKGGLLRFKSRDIPGTVLKGAPDFCTVYIISKTGKISSTRSASRLPPFIHPLRHQMALQINSSKPSVAEVPPPRVHNPKSHSLGSSDASVNIVNNDIKSQIVHRRAASGRPYEISKHDNLDISFVSNGRSSVDSFLPYTDSLDDGPTPPRLSGFSEVEDNNLEGLNPTGRRSIEYLSLDSFVSERNHAFSQEDVEAEMRRLKLELKQTMEMYSTACKEALTAKQKALELERWKMEEQKRLEEARLAEEAALALAEKEKARSKLAIEHAEAAQRIAELEAQKRISAEMKALKEAEEKNKVLSKLAATDYRYRRYTIEEIESATDYFSKSRKIGEGGYGPVYKCYLDHTPVAVKVLRPDAAHGRQQFQQEIEVLSCIRHPNMVLLLGACPEYGCLVYEYMSNGSLEDRLLQRGNTQPLSWQQRFRIAAEIGTGLLFLHQNKPEPLVHRDLKPANILLDRNFVSKISDVGLARLVPPSVADNVTQYRMTSTAGTFCYIDPEYQQTGMLGVKSDVYSLGIIYLQVLTAKSPVGLTHHVEKSIEKGLFSQMLDPAVHDWPVEDAMKLAKLSLKCSELRRRDRPDLGNVVLPELNRLRALAEENSSPLQFYGSASSPNHSQVYLSHENLSYPQSFESSRSRSSTGS
ncbi:U-box domain-containing protein 52-like [Ipomoea triloba]|uniref:U-box domain-containing protein 52-like n=1 Tax=Ipomoea triloba TaxID=35885 RepID=UPI00125D313F|nr:U-box domain-containing protein 52-like [Ipomoea triloba]